MFWSMLHKLGIYVEESFIHNCHIQLKTLMTADDYIAIQFTGYTYPNCSDFSMLLAIGKNEQNL